MIYVGIDLHTRNMTICAVSSNGKNFGEWKLTNSTDQLDGLIREIGVPVKAVVDFMLWRNEPYKGFKGKPTPKDTYLNWPHSVSPHSIRRA